MKKSLILNTIIFLCILTQYAYADLKDETLALCDKVKTCVFEQVGDQELTPQMKSAMTNLVDQQCELMAGRFQSTLIENDLDDDARACLRSIQALSCGEFFAGGDKVETEACIAFEKSANEAGINFDQ